MANKPDADNPASNEEVPNQTGTDDGGEPERTPPPGGSEAAPNQTGAADGGEPEQTPPPDSDHGELEPRAARAAAEGPPPKRTGVFVDPEDLREHVGGLLRRILGGYEVDAYGNFTFVHDQARVFVTVGPSPVGPQVGVFSVTNVDLPLSPDLAAYMATTNHRLGFGALSYDAQNNAVWLRHTLLGTTLDGPELQTAVAAVASTAATVDDHIVAEFGGRTFGDAPEEVQQQARPPEAAGTETVTDEPEVGTTGYL